MDPIVFDLESYGTEERYSRPNDYIRIGGAQRGAQYFATGDIQSFARMVGSAPSVVGHNIIAFDLPALEAQHPGTVDLLSLTRAGRVWDTMVAESLLDPPEADDRPGAVGRNMKRLGLDVTCVRHELTGKTDHIADLAKRHGGFGQIPLDDPEFLAYLRGDVSATRELARIQLPHATPYIMREMRVHALASVMTQAGVLLDLDLAQTRDGEIRRMKAELTARLVAEFGLVTTKADGKPAASPHATKEGKASLVRAFESLGVSQSDLPVTPKGAVSFAGESIAEVGERFGGRVAELCEVIADLSGARTVYGTALSNVHADGRVHPGNRPYQASGRWSVVDPGMTVFGKRGGRVIEREVFVPAEGHVFVSFDLAQIDMRAIAAHCQDHRYIDILSDPDRDLHSEIAAALWGGPTLGNEMRNSAKACGHGWNYGLGAEGLARNAGISMADATRFDSTMAGLFPQLVRWRDEIRLRGEHGPLDNGFGRLMKCSPHRVYTQAPALIGQGPARDLLMECLLRLPDDIARMSRVLVHDETVLEVPISSVDAVCAEIRAASTFEWCPPWASRPVPIRADVSQPGRNWAECYAH